MPNEDGIYSAQFRVKILKFHERMTDLLERQALDPDRLDLETLQTGVEMLSSTLNALRKDGVQAVPAHKLHGSRDPVHLLGDLFTLVEDVLSASEPAIEDPVN